jgi:hypothetical protein
MSSFADNTPRGSSPTAKAARDAARKAAKASWSATQAARREALQSAVSSIRRLFGSAAARWASEIMESEP